MIWSDFIDCMAANMLACSSPVILWFPAILGAVAQQIMNAANGRASSVGAVQTECVEIMDYATFPLNSVHADRH